MCPLQSASSFIAADVTLFFFTVSFSKERKKDITIFFCVILQITVVFYNFCNYTSPLCITFTAKNISYRLGFFLVPARYSQV